MLYNDEGTKEYTIFTLKQIRKFCPAKNITLLNAGCGSNWVKRYVPTNWKCIGLDINNPSADIIADLEKKIPMPDGSVDAILCIHVIEHIKNPLHMLQEFQRILRPGGVIYISTPSPWSDRAWDDPYHVRPYTVHAISALGIDANLVTRDGFYSNNAHGFGALGLTKLKTFYLWYSMNLRFLNNFNLFKGNTEIILQKKLILNNKAASKNGK